MSAPPHPPPAHVVHDTPTPARPPPSPPPPAPVPPFRYPAWLLAAGLVVLAATAYSASLLPLYLRANSLQADAQAAGARGATAEAIRLYSQLLEAVPGARKARIELAILLFRSGTIEDQRAAMGQLTDLSLDRQEWERLRAVMPEHFQALFTRVRGR